MSQGTAVERSNFRSFRTPTRPHIMGQKLRETRTDSNDLLPGVLILLPPRLVSLAMLIIHCTCTTRCLRRTIRTTSPLFLLPSLINLSCPVSSDLPALLLSRLAIWGALLPRMRETVHQIQSPNFKPSSNIPMSWMSNVTLSDSLHRVEWLPYKEVFNNQVNPDIIVKILLVNLARSYGEHMYNQPCVSSVIWLT